MNSKAEQTCKCPEEMVWYSLDKRKKYLDIEMLKFLLYQGNTQEYNPYITKAGYFFRKQQCFLQEDTGEHLAQDCNTHDAK